MGKRGEGGSPPTPGPRPRLPQRTTEWSVLVPLRANRSAPQGARGKSCVVPEECADAGSFPLCPPQAARGPSSPSPRHVVAARAPRKALGSSSANAGPSPPAKKVESKYAGGNPVCVRPTPTWQKGIGEFFRQSSRHAEKENQMPDDEEAGSSGIGRLTKKARPLTPDPTEDDASSEDEQI
ncbi:PCNA-associated factor isoform X2 [Chelonia mydas]|uniref:PCNA-associated factor isoform X2 n=1 Tax=Chelonia mydas TaxID=8469 RepID=UPI001CA8550B|nr:PCNA-associated factor isoform X2 [Chelonia mydas]